jgi:serine/threonine-protein phosphatase 5
MSDEDDAALRNSLSYIITGTESPVASSSAAMSSMIDVDLTPFPSPQLSARSLAGLSRELSFGLSGSFLVVADGGIVSSDGELEPEVDEDKIVTDEDRAEALVVKGKANKAFAGNSFPCLCVGCVERWLTRCCDVDKEFNLSITLYTEAISLNPKDATFWNNRAMSKGKMEEHGGAISDASEC